MPPKRKFTTAIRLVSEGKFFFSPTVSCILVDDYVRQLQDKDIEVATSCQLPASANCATCRGGKEP